jgi:hypothetical protein
MRRLPHEALEDGRETRLVAEPGRQGDLDCGNALAWQYSSAPDPATQQVFVRPEPGLHAESRHEMDPRQAGRRRDFGEADVLIEMGVDLVERASESPFRQFRYTRPLSRAVCNASGR